MAHATDRFNEFALAVTFDTGYTEDFAFVK
jgi:hypothetical protein